MQTMTIGSHQEELLSSVARASTLLDEVAHKGSHTLKAQCKADIQSYVCFVLARVNEFSEQFLAAFDQWVRVTTGMEELVAADDGSRDATLLLQDMLEVLSVGYTSFDDAHFQTLAQADAVLLRQLVPIFKAGGLCKGLATSVDDAIRNMDMNSKGVRACVQVMDKLSSKGVEMTRVCCGDEDIDEFGNVIQAAPAEPPRVSRVVDFTDLGPVVGTSASQIADCGFRRPGRKKVISQSEFPSFWELALPARCRAVSPQFFNFYPIEVPHLLSRCVHTCIFCHLCCPRHPVMDALFETRIKPYTKTFVVFHFQELIKSFKDSLLERSSFWPSGFNGMLPCAHICEDTSEDFTLLALICDHNPPTHAKEELCTFVKALPTNADAQIVMITAAYKVDQLRVDAAKMLKTCVASRKKSVIAVDTMYSPMNVESLVFESDVVEVIAKFMEQLKEVSAFIAVDTSTYTAQLQEDMSNMLKIMEDGASWQRIISEDWRSRWVAGLERMKCNLQGTFPQDWPTFCVENRNEARILEEVCHNSKLDKLLPCQTSLKDSLSNFSKTMSLLKAKQLTPGETKVYDDIITDSKRMLGVRAASTVTLVKIPSAMAAKSKAGFLRECKRLLAALQIDVPTVVLNALETAAAA